MTANVSGSELFERRRQAERRLQDAAGALAQRAGVAWRPPRRRWDLELWRLELEESLAELLERAAGIGDRGGAG